MTTELATTETEEKQDIKIVTIAVYLNGLGQIDSAQGTIDVDFYLRYRWKDPHAAEVKGSPDLEGDKEFWNPSLEVLNRTDLEVVGQTALIDKDHVVRELRFRGGIRCKMPLHDFPFDTQKIHISIESNEHNKSVLQFEPWAFAGTPHTEEIFEHPEFEIMKTYNEVVEHTYPYSLVEGEDKGETFCLYNWCMIVERRSGYYSAKIGSVFAMCLICSWATFFMAPDDIGNRLGIFTTMFLTAVAFQYVVNEKLPNIPYLTKLDHLVNGCYTLLLLSGVEIVIIYQSWRLGMDDDTLFRADMIAFALLASPAIGLGLWFKIEQLRHEEDHVVKLKREKKQPTSSTSAAVTSP